MSIKSLVLACMLAMSLAAPDFARADDVIEFNRDVRPILAENCFDCHGFDAKTRKAELRLDVSDGAYADHDGSTAVKPGDLDGSSLWERVTSDDPEVVMPPPASKKKTLTDDQKRVLQQWIEQGAKYQNHWAFEPPTTKAIPEVADPGGIRNPVDAFIRAKLEQQGLNYSKEADRETLIRRVSFALTGLPPTIPETHQYLSDTSDEAYEAMVDRYLASPHFGEEQARHWLDVARYADTHGLHLDNERQMFAYRDWVVSAFNQNLSFDQFTRWQLAGDLLPEPTLEQLVATGFNRCNVTTSEGGAIADEWLYRYAVDRTSTTMQAWMGLTAGCAVCHDHKFDPVTQTDFYSMYAFFYSATDPAMDGNIRNTNPFIKVPTAEQKAALSAATTMEEATRRQLEDAVATIEYHDPAAAGAEVPQPQSREVSDAVFDDAFPRGAKERNTSRDNVTWLLDPEFGAKSGRRVLELAFGSQYELTLDLPLIPVVIPAEGTIEFWLQVDPYAPPAALSLRTDDGKNRRALWGDKEQLKIDKAEIEMGPLPTAGEWTHVVVPLESDPARPGARIKSLVFSHSGGRIWIDDFRVSGKSSAATDPLSSFQQWWTLSKGTSPAGIDGELNTLLVAGPDEAVAPERRDKLLRFWLQHVQRSTESLVAELRNAGTSAAQNVLAIDDTIPGTFAFGDLEKPRDAFIMLRGQYDKPGDKVEPNVPAAFPVLKTSDGQPLPAEHRANRLDLANWLLSKENPLTARVTVNRVWQHLFGTGLVKTGDDFGTRGDLPSHPELLDWLAIDFRDTGWDTKLLYRLLLTSATFRQDSAISSGLQELDPENRLLARGPRFRLDGEQLRDNALFVSGLIDLKMGGRGVRTYQPPEIWEPVGYENSNTRFYMQDHGSALYRRSLYCFLKRTAPPPFMSNFDGPNREQFCTRRERSNTPLQALQLMNDVQHFEAARALAERTLSEGGHDTKERLTFLFKLVLSRSPVVDELDELTQALQTQLELFSADETAAKKVVNSGESKPTNSAPALEIAAWAMIANLVLNLDETVTRN